MDAAFRHNEIKIVLALEEKSEFYGYPNEFSQAILNVLTNAKDALVENSTKDATIWVRLFEEKDTAVICIEDNAGGIALDIIDRVFDPYFTTKEENKGTGIGLYMSKLIIENHLGGSLSVKNSQNGAEFKIVLNVRSSNVSS
jgi:signal transduction histidine kinase